MGSEMCIRDSYTHDRFIARLEKLARILEEIYILEHTDTEIRPIFLFRRQSENLRNFARILKAYKDEVKRKRLYILEFIYPHLHKTLLDVLMLRIMWKLKGTYYNKAHIVYEIYCNEFSHEVREWVSFHISTEKSYYTRSIPFFTLENILKKAIKRRENRRWTYEYPISIKGLFEVV